jgi:integrase
MEKERDIHNYQRRMDAILRSIQASDFNEANKKALIDFDRSMQLTEQLGLPRRVKLLGTIYYLGRRYFYNDLLHLTIDQLKDCIRDVEARMDSPWTAASYKITLKKWCRWLAYGDEVTHTKKIPKIVSWMTIHIKKKDEPRVQASDILTEDEIHRLIAAAEHPRDRAFISMLYELGARIGEIGSLKVGSITRDEFSYKVDLMGKTGHRTPRIVISDPYLTNWLDQHPFNTDPEAPLWISLEGKTKRKRMMYAALRALVRRLAERAGITKRIYPHLFRHTRVTHLLAKKMINEAQAKVFFGWTPESKVLSSYSHLRSEDVNDTILEMNGIKSQPQQGQQATKLCPRCRRVNTLEAKFCILCSSVLDPTVAFQDEQEKSKLDRLLNLLLNDSDIQAIVLKKLSTQSVEALKGLL